MAAMLRIADISIGALTAGRCCTQASTSNIPRTATVKDGSSEKPADGSAAAGTLRQKEIFIAAYLTTGGRCIEKRPNAEQGIQANRLFL